MKAKYAKAEANVNEIIKVLEKHQVQLMKDTALLDKMYDLNLTYFKELSMYILAGKKKLQEVRNGELSSLTAKAQATGLPEDAQAAKDLDSMCNRFEKKIHDLELTRMISIQTAPQIRLVQNNDTLMVEKIQSTIVNTIPLWKSQMVLALGVEHSTQAAAGTARGDGYDDSEIARRMRRNSRWRPWRRRRNPREASWIWIPSRQPTSP